jgi:hypothetical protein
MVTVLHDENINPLAVANAIKSELREMIADWSARHPNRLIMRIGMKDIKELAATTVERRILALKQLDGYTGAALPDGPVRIPWPYELHVMMFSEVIEVLLLSDELKARPLRRMADEVAQLALDQSRALIVDEVFDFWVPASVLERVQKVHPSSRAQFRATLNRRLAAFGLSIHHGSISGTLQIHKDC